MHLMHSIDRHGRSGKDAIALATLVPLLVVLLAAASPASAGATLDRIKSSGKLTLGYGADARPFSYKDESGNPAGYAIALCGKIAEAAKTDLGLSSLAVDYVPVAREEGVRAVAQGKIDILCEATVPTLKLRKEVSYSIPIFASGIGAVVLKDAPTRLKDILSGRTPPTSPTWRANADQLLRNSTVSVVAGTRAERAVTERLSQLQLIPKLVLVDSYAAGIDRVLDGRSNVFFGDRAVLLDAVKEKNLSGQLQVLDRFFTHETLAFAVPRDDENLRLVVDAALSRLFRSQEFRDVYGKWFGPLKDETWTLFKLTALPE
jgi:polar amino acid transport system substrate-binding protein